MTEDEARKKWRPFARVSRGGAAVNRIPDDAHRRAGATSDPGMYRRQEADFLCVASACMAWRSAPTSEFFMRGEAEYRREGRRLEPGPDDVAGHCGLAGTPPT